MINTLQEDIKMIINNKEYVSVNEASTILNKSHITVRSYIKRGILVPTYFGSRTIFLLKTDVVNLTK